MSKLKFGYAPIHLSSFPGLEEKFEAVTDFLEILGVFCELSDEQDPGSLNTEKKLVTQIVVPGGTPFYIKSLTQEIREILIESIDNYVKDLETTQFDMEQTLKNIKDRCVLQGKMHNINNSMEYDPGRILFLTYRDTMHVKLYFDHLKFTLIAKKNLEDHFYIRQKFFEAMVELLDTKIVELSEPLLYTKQPYQWTSDSPHYEIAELLYALINRRIQIKEGEKGSNAKLVKNFYNLFGYDDSTYHQKLQEIKNRKKKSWLFELVEVIDDVQKRKKTTKK